LYRIKDCPGNPEFIEREGKVIKNCTNCTFPHKEENYDIVISVLKKKR
jgi:Zn-finger protein